MKEMKRTKENVSKLQKMKNILQNCLIPDLFILLLLSEELVTKQFILSLSQIFLNKSQKNKQTPNFININIPKMSQNLNIEPAKPFQMLQSQPSPSLQQAQQSQQQQQLQQQYQQSLPQHFYDSDIASVCEKDFLSDHQPPKDIIQQRKLLYKEKFLHVFKTIIRIGEGIDRPAKYDKMLLKHKEVPKDQIMKKLKKQTQNGNIQIIEGESHNQSKKQNQNQDNSGEKQHQSQQKQQHVDCFTHPPYYYTEYLDAQNTKSYNLGTLYQQIQRFVTSMKRGQTALFQLQHLETSKKSNIKIKKKTQIHLIHVYDWITVIDLESDMKMLKQIIKKGEGAFRVNFYDQASFQYKIQAHSSFLDSQKQHMITLRQKKYENIRFQKQFTQNELGRTIWRVLISMKNKQQVDLLIKLDHFRQYENQSIYQQILDKYQQITGKQHEDKQFDELFITINIHELIKIDDIYLDGRLLKKTLVKGVSTAKPESSSLVYYALKFIDLQTNQLLKQDSCFDSDWWQDFEQLQLLQGIRKSYLDDYSVSKMLKAVIKRMKPAQIAQIECRDTKNLLKFGQDYVQLQELLKFKQTNQPQKIRLMIRIYNFTQGKNAFNMQIEQKIIQSRRKKIIATKLFQYGNLKKALKRFQNIVAFYSSQKINQQAYEEKISALMNSVLCHMKLKNYVEMVKLCDQIIKKPRHGHQVKDLTIHGPGNVKIQGNDTKSKQEQGEGQLEQGSPDTRRIAKDLVQNVKILDKCLYRKAYALLQMGECEQSLLCISLISSSNNQSEQVLILKQQSLKGQLKYQSKSKKIFQSMFSK